MNLQASETSQETSDLREKRENEEEENENGGTEQVTAGVGGAGLTEGH